MINNVIEMSRNEGMILLETCLHELYRKGIISYDVAIAHAENPARIRELAVSTEVKRISLFRNNSLRCHCVLTA
ncbi:MAG: hypothetical protein RMK94_15545 [Armatimonadota bacterium]|nr:hypothetical protein [Armatimonadota bacterium]